MATVQYIEDVLGANGGVMPTSESSKSGTTGDYATATNAIATITYTAPGAGVYNVISGVWWSLSASPTTTPVTVTIQDAGVTIFSFDIIVGGPGGFPFNRNLRTALANTAMTVSISAGGVGIVGKINARRWTE